jgi:hypothetical protein
MTNHPITPPPELVQQWIEEDKGGPGVISKRVFARAAQWGYEQRGEVNDAELQKARVQELEACCEWLRHEYGYFEAGADLAFKLRAARRPKPPSLKEQACNLLECYGTSGVKLTADQCNTIREALEDSNG